ncbi:MAG: hypothetical protein ABJD68_14145 [Nakamurella sp.]
MTVAAGTALMVERCCRLPLLDRPLLHLPLLRRALLHRALLRSSTAVVEHGWASIDAT